MESGKGRDIELGVGSGASNGGKRKWRGGSGSGDGQEHHGDPPTSAVLRAEVENHAFLGVMEDPPVVGVRVRVIVEIKGWIGKSVEFSVDVKSPKDDVLLRKVVAAIIHDLARLYRDRNHPVQKLNIRSVELWIRKQHGAEEQLGTGDGLLVKNLLEKYVFGKALLDKYVHDHPLTPAPEEWVRLSKEGFADLKEEIARRGLEFYNVLRKAIAEKHSRAGRQRQDEDEIPPPVEGYSNLEEEVKSLKEEIAAKDAEIVSLKKQKEEDVVKITSLMKSLSGTASLDTNSSISVQKEEIQRLKAESESKDAEIASLKERVQKAQGGYLFNNLYQPGSPTSGLM